MKKLLVIILFFPLLSEAQSSTAFWEIGVYTGGLNYSGDINKEGDIGTWINEMKPEFGLVLKRNFNYRVNMGVEAGWGTLYAADKNHNLPERDYVMSTDIVQANVVFEINFKKFGKYFKRNQNTPFVKTGMGILFFTPELNDNAEYPIDQYELYWGTYSTYNFQVAFGWKWRISYHSFLSLDMHYNSTGASYLEGFNLKDSPNPNDSYYGLRLTYSYGIF
jgi:hypothetical protein